MVQNSLQRNPLGGYALPHFDTYTVSHDPRNTSWKLVVETVPSLVPCHDLTAFSGSTSRGRWSFWRNIIKGKSEDLRRPMRAFCHFRMHVLTLYIRADAS